MFRMLGKKVELIRYKVTWQEDEQEIQEDCITAIEFKEITGEDFIEQETKEKISGIEDN